MLGETPSRPAHVFDGLERELVPRVSAPRPRHPALGAVVPLLLRQRDRAIGVLRKKLRLAGLNDPTGEHRMRDPVGTRLLKF
jgi:hypothetical protein